MCLDNYTYDELQEELARREEEKKRSNELPPDKSLAETLHRVLCKSEHLGGCWWFYEASDPDKWSGVAHQYWLEKAQKALQVFDAHLYPYPGDPINIARIVVSILKAVI